MTTSDGPYQTEAQAREQPAVRAIYDAAHADRRRGVMAEGGHRLLEEACTAASVELGAYDRRILAWLAGWEPQTCAVIAGLITRAARAQRAPAILAGNYDLTSAEQRTILAALDDTADHKRDLAASCPDCADQTCGTCDARLRAAHDCGAVSAQIQAQLYRTPQTEAEPDPEAGQ
jgi:hypothetical protein